jgi:hypothetical protein
MLVAGLTRRRSLRPDRNLFVLLAFHLGYHSLPVGNVMPGFSMSGWAVRSAGPILRTEWPFALVHNRLLTPFVMTDRAAFVESTS